MSVILLKGFATLLQVLRPIDRSMDWISGDDLPNTVPNDKDALRQWLRVVSALPKNRKTVTRQLRVMYNLAGEGAPSGRVEIRVQGMLENANLHPKGELRGRSGCRGAENVQWLRLGCNAPAFRERFRHQIEVLRAVVDACREQLGYRPISAELPDSIVCRRPIRVDGCVPLVIRTMGVTGCLTSCSHKDLGTGDLLDVKLWVDITLTRGSDTVPRMSINLAFDEIVVVQVASDVKRCRAMHNMLKRDMERDYRCTETVGFEASKRVDRPMSNHRAMLVKEFGYAALDGVLG